MPESLRKSEEEIARLEELEFQRMKKKHGEENLHVREAPAIEKNGILV